MVRLSQFILQNPFLLLFPLTKRYTKEQLDSRYLKKASKLCPFGSLFYFSIFWNTLQLHTGTVKYNTVSQSYLGNSSCVWS